MGEIRTNQRIDALHSEAYIIFSLHNLLLANKAIGWEVSQKGFAEHLRMGERTVQRVTKRLMAMGRLNRSQGKGHSQYIYSLTPNAIPDTMIDITFSGNLFFIETPEGYISLARGFDEFLEGVAPSEQNEN